MVLITIYRWIDNCGLWWFMVLITIVILDGLIHSSGSTLRVLGLPLSLRAQASNKLIQDQLRVVTWERYGGQRPAIFWCILWWNSKNGLPKKEETLVHPIERVLNLQCITVPVLSFRGLLHFVEHHRGKGKHTSEERERGPSYPQATS